MINLTFMTVGQILVGMCSVPLGWEEVGLKSWPRSWLWVAGGCWHLVPPGGFGLIFQLEFQLLWASPPALFSCLVLVFSRQVPVVMQGLFSCSLCVYINVCGLLVGTNKKSWSSARRQIMSQLVPGSRAGREVSQGSNLTAQLQNEVVDLWDVKMTCKAKPAHLPGVSGRNIPPTLSHPECCCDADIKWIKLNNLCAPARFSHSGHWGLK